MQTKSVYSSVLDSSKISSEERKTKMQSGAITALVSILFFLVLWIFGIPRIDPPLTASGEGINIILGNDMEGMNETFEGVAAGSEGDNNSPDNTQSTPPPSNTNPPSNTETAIEESDNGPEIKKQPERVVQPVKTDIKTQTQPDKVITKTTTENPNPPKKTVEERKFDSDKFGFKKSGNNGHNGTGGPGTSKGNGDHHGDQGSPDGDPNSTSWIKRGNGNNPDGNGGNEWEMEGGTLKHIPKVAYTPKADGKIVVSFVVDRDGNVIEVHGGARGSTILENAAINAAEDAVKKLKATPLPNGPERRKGKVVYKWRFE
ncbi:MAG: hypothetical protein NTX03_00425 [Bacteroidetes bacterium]|nr:hypothetical protein [Bacteroidota bacterium]